MTIEELKGVGLKVFHYGGSTTTEISRVNTSTFMKWNLVSRYAVYNAGVGGVDTIIDTKGLMAQDIKELL